MCRWFACIIFIILLSYNNICEGAAIDVGTVPIDRNSPLSNRTLVEEANPANLTGTIDHIDVWTSTDINGSIDFASFSASGNNLATNGTAEGLTHTAGDNNFDAPGDFTAFDINSGEYIGEFTADNPDMDTSGGTGMWIKSGDSIPTTSTAFSHMTNWVMSLYATGVTASSVQPQVIIITNILQWFNENLFVVSRLNYY